MPLPQEKLLILDLDETLVYATEHPLSRATDFLAGPYRVYKRPSVDEFLAPCLEWFAVAVWTSSSPAYAAAVTAALFAEPKRLAFVWAGDRCTQVYDHETGESCWRKNLKKVKQKGYAAESVLVVDDSPEKWSQSHGNLVLVRPFVGAQEDDELRRLARYLEDLRNVPDVRAVEKRGWRAQVASRFSPTV